MGALFQLTKDTALPLPGARVLKHGDAAALLEAGNILDTAKKRAAQIIADAEAAYEARKEEGYRDGQEEGRLEHAEKMMETVISSVEFIENIEKTVVDVVNQAIRKVIGDLDDDERIVRIVRNALSSVRNQQQVTIRVAPADEKAVSDALASFLKTIPGSPSFMNLVADGRLARGACLLESELGVVDASLETQLTALKNAFQAKIES